MDRAYDTLRRVVGTREAENKLGEQRYQEQSAKRLGTIIETKLKTSFIGALSQFEQEFGYLWGHGKGQDELTDEELKMRIKWEKVRNNVLNNGNNQIRAIQNELTQYTVKWNRYQYNISVKEQGDNG